MKDLNDDDTLVLSSSREVLQFNERGNCFYNTMRDIVERTYRHTFHLQYKNRSSDSKSQVIHKLYETFPKQWAIQFVRLAIEKTYNNKKESYKKYYY